MGSVALGEHRHARLARSVLMLVAFIGAVAVHLWGDVAQQFGVRAVAWGAAAVLAFTLGCRDRPEPRSSWLAIGGGSMMIAISWFARTGDLAGLPIGTWPDALSSSGLLMLGLGLMLAGSGIRERVALFDGALLGGAVLTFAWAILLAPQMEAMAQGAVRVAAGAHVAGGALVLGVGVALGLAERRTLPKATPWFVVGVTGLTMGGIGWGWQGIQGNTQAMAGSVGWVVAAVAVALVAWTPEAPENDPEPAQASLLTPTRFVLLVGLTIMPALTVGILRASPSMRFEHVPVTMGLWVTVASVIVLALRVRAVGGFAIQDVEAEARDRFAHLIEHSADVVAVVAPDGTIKYLSPSTKRVFAHDPDALIGTSVRDVIENGHSERVDRLLQTAVEGDGRPVPLRLTILAGDGIGRPAEGTVTDLSGLPSVGGLVITLRDISERVALEHELKRAALEDPLTGLANRTLVADRVRHALAQQQRGGAGVALLFLDLDEFKAVNDTHGHAVGDRLLKVVADRLRKVIRDVDTAGRLGGDEFAVVLEGLPAEGVVDSAQQVIARLLEEFDDPIPVGNDYVYVRASIGVAVADAGMSVDDLVRNADMAMYDAKGAGGARVSVYREGLAMLRPGVAGEDA